MIEQLLDYTGKVVLITGASSGIGRAVAFAFARQGATICVGDVSAALPKPLSRSSGTVGNAGKSVISILPS